MQAGQKWERSKNEGFLGRVFLGRVFLGRVFPVYKNVTQSVFISQFRKTKEVSRKSIINNLIRNHQDFDLYPVIYLCLLINLYPLIDLYPVIDENTVAVHPVTASFIF